MQRLREYRPKNREKFREYDKRWSEANPDHKSAYMQSYYRQNRDRILAKSAEYREANAERYRAYERERSGLPKRIQLTAMRRARIAGLPYENINRQAIYNRDGGRCHICGKKAERSNFHLDHLIPVAHGGGYLAVNLRVAHPSCNARRGAGRLPAQLLLVG